MAVGGEPDHCVRVRGARVHNLCDVDVDIPRDTIVAFTGVSGSGKSSLAFGTIYAEAQRRYFESVAPYARRFLHPAVTPDVDDITGLPPAVALQQRRVAATSRSSVGTLTSLSNLVRMLFSRAGTYPPGAEPLPAEAFSPNTPAGACPVCHGLGRTRIATEASMVPDPTRSIREGAIAAWPGGWQGRNLRDIVTALGYDVDRPWKRLSRKARDWLLFTEEQPVVLVDPEEDRDEWPYNGKFVSAERHVMHTIMSSPSERMRERALRFVEVGPCRACGGSGLNPAALAVTFGGHDIASINTMPLRDVAAALRPTGSEATLDAVAANDAAVTITADLAARSDVLCELGLGYLSLARPTTTLSPGEVQRLRIATQLRSGLFGVVYVLDEPSAGLHPADAAPLLDLLDRLRDAGNSVFVVEHDLDIVRRAGWVVDVGPGPGDGGGRVLYSGPLDGLARVTSSVTRRYLHGSRGVAAREPRSPSRWMSLRGVESHNLHHVDVDVPLGVLTAITGVSGAGKTTLASAVLGRGATHFDRVVEVDQRPIGRTPRSNLATYTGFFDEVRRVFASTPEARSRGYGPGRFSFNVPGGRCETCQGEGFVSVELMFLPSTFSPCPTCHGARFNEETLEIRYRGVDIAGVLALRVHEAVELLAGVPRAVRSLQTLQEVGLGYLRLGQPATELSGGEAQRIKLATELQRPRRGETLYVLDEPTTGLHPADVELLVAQLHRLVDAGHTVVVVEHDLDVVAGADWVIDLGPGAGDEGGRIVATGTPRQIASATGSRTMPYLAARLAEVT